MKFLILNGPNLNLLGSREPGVYGPESYEGLCRRVRDFAAAHGASADCFQSNHEGALIDAIHSARGTYEVEFPIWSAEDTSRLVFANRRERTELPASDGGRLFESNGFYWQLRSFLLCLLEGRKSPDDLRSALETMRLTDCLRERRERI